MRTKLLILSYALLMACAGEDELPNGILSQERMVPIIIDIYTAEGKVSSLGVNRDSSLAIFEVYEDTIFDIHEVKEENYRKSMTYYFSHPDQLESIYEAVLDSLNLYEQQIKEMKEKKANN